MLLVLPIPTPLPILLLVWTSPNKDTKNVDGINYASVLKLIIGNSQSKCENNLTCYILNKFGQVFYLKKSQYHLKIHSASKYSKSALNAKLTRRLQAFTQATLNDIA